MPVSASQKHIEQKVPFLHTCMHQEFNSWRNGACSWCEDLRFNCMHAWRKRALFSNSLLCSSLCLPAYRKSAYMVEEKEVLVLSSRVCMSNACMHKQKFAPLCMHALRNECSHMSNACMHIVKVAYLCPHAWTVPGSAFQMHACIRETERVSWGLHACNIACA